MTRLLLAGLLVILAAFACVAYWRWDLHRPKRENPNGLAKTITELQQRRSKR